jgi:hypothetical protein
VLVVDSVTAEAVIDEHTASRFYSAVLPTNGSWRVRVEADGAEAATRSVEFRTTTLQAPAPLEPELGSTVPEGPLTLRWSAVEGSTAYEYLVMQPGGLRPAARGVVSGLSAEISLPARGGATQYSAILRACPEGRVCRGGRDRGWGRWSTDAGTGATNFTVVPE